MIGNHTLEELKNSFETINQEDVNLFADCIWSKFSQEGGDIN